MTAVARFQHEDGPPLQRDRFDEHEVPTRPSIVPLTLLDELLDWGDADEPTDVYERSGIVEAPPTPRNPEHLSAAIQRVLEDLRRRGEE